MHRAAPLAEEDGGGGGGAAEGRGGIRKTIANISIRNKKIRVGDLRYVREQRRRQHGEAGGQGKEGRE